MNLHWRAHDAHLQDERSTKAMHESCVARPPKSLRRRPRRPALQVEWRHRAKFRRNQPELTSEKVSKVGVQRRDARIFPIHASGKIGISQFVQIFFCE